MGPLEIGDFHSTAHRRDLQRTLWRCQPAGSQAKCLVHTHARTHAQRTAGQLTSPSAEESSQLPRLGRLRGARHPDKCLALKVSRTLDAASLANARSQ